MRLVADGICTFTEITTTMSIDDVELLGITADILFDARNAPPK